MPVQCKLQPVMVLTGLESFDFKSYYDQQHMPPSNNLVCVSKLAL